MFLERAIETLQDSVPRDCGAFLPELVLCTGIIVLLLLRLFSAFDRWHLGWLALGFTGIALAAACDQWVGGLEWIPTPDQFRAEAKFSTWLIQIAINEARMRRRRDRKPLYDSLDAGQETEEGDYMPMDLADWREIPSEAVERRQLRDALARALALLKPQYREVFMLRDVQKRNIAETAELLGVTAVTVKMRLLRARLQMRDALAPGFDGSWSAGETKSRRVRNATFY